jgi:tRNA threonylcarbamoyladenosine biosynthesis protein TsaB
VTSASAFSRVLAICSATRNASVALLRDGEPALELWAARGRQHAESLLPLVDAVLRRCETNLSQIDGFALCIGPGSFTCLRVGLSTLKGLAFASEVPVAAVSSLEALAAASGDEAGRPVIGMLDAMRDEVYAAAFSQRDCRWIAQPGILPERVYDADELADRIPAHALLVGEGTRVVFERLRERLGTGIEEAAPVTCDAADATPGEAGLIGEPQPSEPSAATVGRIGHMILRAGQGVSAASLAPRYVRRAEAEVQRTNERFESPPDPAGRTAPNPRAGFDTTRKLS